MQDYLKAKKFDKSKTGFFEVIELSQLSADIINETVQAAMHAPNANKNII
jgi:hypothetical protein